MKSRGLGCRLFQVVVQDFKHRKPVPATVVQSGQVWKRNNNIEEIIPVRTLLKWAKDGRRATVWAKRFGSVISCRKVDSHFHRLSMIDYLRIELKPVEVDISAEEFIIGRDLEIKPVVKTKKVDTNNT